MQYLRLVEVYEKLEATSAKLKKTEVIADFFAECEPDILPKVALLLQGLVFPAWSEKEIGIATNLMVKIIANTTGFSEGDILDKFKKTGDLGLVIEGLVSGKKQRTLFSMPLTVEKAFENLQKVTSVEGKGSQERKFQLVSELLSSATPREARYLVRTTLGDLRVGVAEGLVRDAIAKAFFADII